MVKKVILLVVATIVAASCVKTNIIHTVESGYFNDSWARDDTSTVYANFTVIPTWLKGERFIGIQVQNIVQTTETKKYLFSASEPEGGAFVPILPREFRSFLESVSKYERDSTSFIPRITTNGSKALGAKGCEISWKMFDEIYAKYSWMIYENYK